MKVSYLENLLHKDYKCVIEEEIRKTSNRESRYLGGLPASYAEEKTSLLLLKYLFPGAGCDFSNFDKMLIERFEDIIQFLRGLDLSEFRENYWVDFDNEFRSLRRIAI